MTDERWMDRDPKRSDPEHPWEAASAVGRTALDGAQQTARQHRQVPTGYHPEVSGPDVNFANEVGPAVQHRGE